jgi:hypothetical protein
MSAGRRMPAPGPGRFIGRVAAAAQILDGRARRLVDVARQRPDGGRQRTVQQRSERCGRGREVAHEQDQTCAQPALSAELLQLSGTRQSSVRGTEATSTESTWQVSRPARRAAAHGTPCDVATTPRRHALLDLPQFPAEYLDPAAGLAAALDYYRSTDGAVTWSYFSAWPVRTSSALPGGRALRRLYGWLLVRLADDVGRE